MPRRIRIADERFWPQSALVEQLAALGLAAGDSVMVHASLRRVGPMPGGADTLIAALRERIGADGT
ncbi:MAG: aminoglycoside 3-N-acetyltransferase, partial [Pseudomonadota bacterium]